MPLPKNFLQDLVASTQGGRVEPSTFAQSMASESMRPESAPIQTRAMTTADAGPAPSLSQSVARPRRSVLDIIGGAADVFATVGGAEPLYQRGLDEQLARQNAAQDREEMIDINALKRQQAEQQLTRGQQEIKGGEQDIQKGQNDNLRAAGDGLRAVFGRSGLPGVLKAIPLIGNQFGVPPEQLAEITQAMTADPEGTIEALFPVAPENNINMARELQLIRGLNKARQEGDTETFGYLKNILDNNTAAEPISAQQLELNRLSQERNDLARRRVENPPVTVPQQLARAKAAAAAESKTRSAAEAIATLDELAVVYERLNDVGAMVNSKRGAGENIGARVGASELGQLVGGAIGTETQELLDQVASIRPFIMQQLVKAMGLTGKQLDSNADVKLLMKTVTDPTQSYTANKDAITRLRRTLDGITSSTDRQRPASSAGRQRPASSAGREITTISTKEQYERLPKGARFVDDKGNKGVKR